MGTGSGIQFLDYTFDTLGNLQQRSRSEGTTSLSESFNYDALNRLKLVSISGVGNKTYNYDSLGNITQKGTVSDYRYAERAAGPHAVSYANGQNYDYDANGNMLSGAGRTLTWSSYNKPIQIQKGQTSVQFDYGPDRARYRQVKTTGSETTTTVYIGKLYEQISKAGTTERKHYIIAGGRTIAIYSDKGAGQTTTQYLHHDHLGSVDVITDASGAAVERLSFAAFGSRRNIDWTDATGLITSQFTTRGFTGQEQLDEVGLVHMNGRVYDPVLGRFLSADPQVQFPSASQSFNRYSYVHNNPLSYTDPSGFGLFSGFKKLFKGIGSAIKKAFKSPVFRAIVGIAAAYLTYGALNGAFIWGGNFTTAFASGFVGGAITTGSLKGALVGGATALAFYGVGSTFPSASKLRGAAPWEKGRLWFGKIVAHGTVGGASSAAQGGSFQDGFRSAGFTQLAAPVIGSVPGAAAGRTAAAAIVGGTASRLGGGKFANGAVTGAFSYLFTASTGQRRNASSSEDLSVNTAELNDGSLLVNVNGNLILGGADVQFNDSTFIVFDKLTVNFNPFTATFEASAVLIDGTVTIADGQFSAQFSELAFGGSLVNLMPTSFSAQGAFTRQAFGLPVPGIKRFNFSLTGRNFNIPTIRNRIEDKAFEFP
ncbi:hypothetical protein MNBD_GAMMA13-952 [hydrothermal vent metagenome]|uniref:Teneurin-like YD-shell domain-containing protein n=1 Tax=hydrothermal vent metagenome TaxID=652676 RepID=A0A3B0YNW0_9ZZZZ